MIVWWASGRQSLSGPCDQTAWHEGLIWGSPEASNAKGHEAVSCRAQVINWRTLYHAVILALPASVMRQVESQFDLVLKQKRAEARMCQ